MKTVLRFLASRVSEKSYERLLAPSVFRENFAQLLAQVPTYKKREELWERALMLSAAKITYVEFGVYAGYSIKFFADKNKNMDSIFIGLDSFEGLPEDWGMVRKGSFDVKGVIPEIEDARVKFVKGLFQNTWADFISILPDAGDLIVHYDADLYSSTLFALTKIDSLKRSYLAIFDEFHSQEARAFRNYQQAYNPKVQFLGKAGMLGKAGATKGYPQHVLCKIEPV